MGDMEQGGYTFRLGTPSDAGDISRVISKTWEETYGHTVPPEDMALYLETKVSESAFSKELKKEDERFVLAFVPSQSPPQDIPPIPLLQLAGIAQLSLKSSLPEVTLPHHIELQRLYVSSSHHGSGVASALMRQVEVQARAEGAQSIWLGTWENAHRAVAFYRKCGFETVGIKDFMIGGTVHHDFIMQKRI